jgi:hypothetical protein
LDSRVSLANPISFQPDSSLLSLRDHRCSFYACLGIRTCSSSFRLPSGSFRILCHQRLSTQSLHLERDKWYKLTIMNMLIRQFNGMRPDMVPYLTEGVLILHAATMSFDHDTLSTTNSSWSKEQIFGLLSVLVVILLPCLGLLLRLCITKCRSRRVHESTFESIN